MRTQAEKREETREAILCAATTTILEFGYNSCSISKIAHNSPFTTGAIQHHFKSKDDLLKAVITEYIFKINNASVDKLDTATPLEQRCQKVVAAMWEYYGHKYYSVVWEIMLGARNNKLLLNEINEFFNIAEQKVEKGVSIIFSDLMLSNKDSKKLTKFISSHLRGISLLRFSNPSADVILEQLEYLELILLLKLKEYAKKI